jgi:hypothetical protein
MALMAQMRPRSSLPQLAAHHLNLTESWEKSGWQC